MFGKISALQMTFLVLMGSLSGQIPTSFTNLQSLPDTIGRGDLINVMKGFTGALGVRCLHCHTGTDGNNFTDVVFAADDLETKRIARMMIDMTRVINRTIVTESGRPLSEIAEVTCKTCHHGATEPKDLTSELNEAYIEGGSDAVLVLYDDLRAKYYGRSRYDFKHSTLTNFASTIHRKESNTDGAIQILKKNLTYFPDSHFSWYMLAQIYFDDGQKRAAISSARRSVELDPGNKWYQANLDEFSQ